MRGDGEERREEERERERKKEEEETGENPAEQEPLKREASVKLVQN